jgi:hypothetical protein
MGTKTAHSPLCGDRLNRIEVVPHRSATKGCVMLAEKQNDILCRVGPGTPVGELFRSVWLPAVLSAAPFRSRHSFRDNDQSQSGVMTCRRVSPGCPFCPPRGLPDGSRKLLVRARPLQPIARGWLAAVAAVEAEPTLQLGDPALQAFNQLLQRGVLPRHLRFCPQDRADSPAESLAA